MQVCIDIEANGLEKPTKIWCIVCKDIDTGIYYIFRIDDERSKENFVKFTKGVSLWIGHNILGYDLPVIRELIGVDLLSGTATENVVDTLILSKLVNYSRPSHSIEHYGVEFGLEKIDVGKSVAGHNPFFNQWSQQMEDYCVRDVEICHRVYRRYADRVSSDLHSALALEQRFQLICNDLHTAGFGFNTVSAEKLKGKLEQELAVIDGKILEAFPPREVLIREFTPRATKFGTINKSSVPRSLHPRIHEYEVGRLYRHTKQEPFNPSSHKQLIQVLIDAGWAPEDKTKTHIDTERALSLLKRGRGKNVEGADVNLLQTKLDILRSSGWQINENNLSTLPASAPEPARLLAKRILLESRRRTLTEWLGLVDQGGRIHGKFYGIGAWTHRMAHQQPNTANIPREFKEDGTPKLLGKEMRSLWIAPKNRLLVGVDAEGIQLRIFAHYINDEEFTDALIRGKKSDKSDPHSLNQRILGDVCKTRQAAKRFVYALLLGGGISKLAQILGCSVSEAKSALSRLLQRYEGFRFLKEKVIPQDARKGYFIGLDGRHVSLPGETQRDREHLCMSGYLQNGETIIIKRAAILSDDALHEEKKLGYWKLVDIVHDEFVSDVRNSLDFAVKVAKIKAEAIAEAGRIYNLRCPMAGSYWNDDSNEYTIGMNWYKVH